MIRINLAPGSERTATTKKKAAGPAAPPGALQAYLLLGLFVGGAAVLCFGLWWIQKSKLESLSQQITADEKRQRDLQAIKVQVDQFEQKKAVLKNKVETIEKLRLAQKSPVHMLDEVSKALPDYVWLTSMDEVRGNVAFKGQSNSIASVAEFMTAMQRSGWFPSIELGGTTDQQNLVNFDLTGQFKDPEVAAKEAAKAAASAQAPPGAPGRPTPVAAR
jgi:type IV pilus assembly protein PilN